MLHEIVGRHALWPRPQAADGEDLPAFGVVEDDRRDARDIDEVALQHAKRDAGRHARIDGVAASLQD
jgi:hypothetical protein